MRFSVESDSIDDFGFGFFFGVVVLAIIAFAIASILLTRSLEEFKKKAIHAGAAEYRCNADGVSEFHFIHKEEKK